MRKWSLLGVVFLFLCMAGCANEQDNPVTSEIVSNSDSVQIIDSTALPSNTKINEKLDDNLLVEAEFQMPEEELFTWSSKLKKFDYDKIQSIFWPDASSKEITTDEFGMRYYKKASLGADMGSLIYTADDEIEYIDTLCYYAKEKNLIPEKDLRFETRDEAAKEAEALLSKLDLGCELSEPYIIALNSEDLHKVQKKIMKDADYKDILSAKKLGSKSFENDMEIYYLEYSFVIGRMPVFGHDDPTVQYTGDKPLLAQNMRAVVTLSKSGIQRVDLQGVLDGLTQNPDIADIIDYEGIKKALDKKFGDVILTDKYKVIRIWMEYFPLIESDSFEQVSVIPVWCLDFEINGEIADYTLRFNACTGEEIS